MPSVYDIKRTSSKADTCRSNINYQKRRMKNEVDATNSWWKGEAASSFTNRYSGIDNDIRRIEKSIENIEYYLERLAREVEEAENEKRIRLRNANR